MAGSCACHSFCQNVSPNDKDELAGAAPIESSGTPIPISIVSRVSTPAPATAPAAALSSDNELFKQFIKAHLEARVPDQTKVDPKPCEQPLRAQFPDLYYGNLHMDCYQFCQKYKDHFETAGAKKPNRIPFAALFLRGLVTQ